MKIDKLEKSVNIPEGVNFSYSNGFVKVSGPKGEVEKKLFHPGLDIVSADGNVNLSYCKATKREKAMIFTFVAHIKNLFKGVTQGHTYELKICSGHFPMNVSLSGDSFTVKNFIGEKVPRTLKIKNNVSVKISGDQIIVEHINKEFASQIAADIETLTKRRGFDTRIFQDGIYIVNKDGKAI